MRSAAMRSSPLARAALPCLRWGRDADLPGPGKGTRRLRRLRSRAACPRELTISAAQTKRVRLWWILLGLVGCGLVGLGATYYFWPQARPELIGKSQRSCWGVGECADDCSQRCPDDLKKYPCMLDCSTRCASRGCAGAGALHDRLTSCVKRSCLLRCLGGPSPDCKRCTLKRCKAESEVCRAHRCPDGQT